MKQYNAIQDTNKMKYYVLYHEGRTVSLKWQGMKTQGTENARNGKRKESGVKSMYIDGKEFPSYP